MSASSNAVGPEWCPPTREIKSSQLLKLVHKTKHTTAELQAQPGHDVAETGIPLIDRARRESCAPLEEAWFRDSESIAYDPTDRSGALSQPVTIETTHSRFTVDPLERAPIVTPPEPAHDEVVLLEPKQPQARGVYPVYQGSGSGRAVIRVLLLLALLGSLGAYAFTTFGM